VPVWVVSITAPFHAHRLFARFSFGLFFGRVAVPARGAHCRNLPFLGGASSVEGSICRAQKITLPGDAARHVPCYHRYCNESI